MCESRTSSCDLGSTALAPAGSQADRPGSFQPLCTVLGHLVKWREVPAVQAVLTFSCNLVGIFNCSAVCSHRPVFFYSIAAVLVIETGSFMDVEWVWDRSTRESSSPRWNLRMEKTLILSSRVGVNTEVGTVGAPGPSCLHLLLPLCLSCPGFLRLSCPNVR